MKKIIQKTMICTAAVLMIPFISTRPVNAAMGPGDGEYSSDGSFYDGNFEYKLATSDGYVDYNGMETYVQPEIVEAKEPEKVTILCIENQYHGVDSNIVIPESSASGCGFATLGESSNAYYYTATEADWNGRYAVITDYRGPDITDLVIPAYLNDGTKVSGVSFDTNLGRGKARQTTVKTISVPDSISQFNMQQGMFPELEKLEVSDQNNAVRVVDGVLFSKDMKQLKLYPEYLENESYTVPEGVTAITTFGANKHLKELTLPSTLRNVENTFLKGCSVEKIGMAGNNKYFTVEDGILYSTPEWSPNRILMFYPKDKTDKSFTIKGSDAMYLQAFEGNPYLEELTIGTMHYEDYSNYSSYSIPNLKSIKVAEGKNAVYMNPYTSLFSHDGILYSAYRDVTDSMTAAEKFADYVHMVYYPPGKPEEFLEFPEGLEDINGGVLGDHVEAIYIHKNSTIYYRGKNLKYVYLEAGAENNYYGSSVLTKENITLEDAKADFESKKKAEQQKEEEAQKPQETAEPEPAETATPTPEPTPVPTAAPAKPQSSGSAGLIAGGVILIAAAAGAYVFLKKKQTPSK